jgi:hypothetical protein
MAISINYSVSARDVLTHPEFPARLRQMKRAGVEHLWLYGYFYGHHEADPEQIYRARLLLEEEGFRTGVLSLPVGHPGNSLNPDDPTLELAINPAWHYRIDRRGQKEYFIACIDEIMTAHNTAAAKEYAQMGFTRHFFDDDLRLGNWGDQIQGCFCDICIDNFSLCIGQKFTRDQLASAIDSDPAIREAWIRFNCDKLTGFMHDTAVPGMTSGIMVMHNGNRIHGISIPDIKAAVPDCMFRVGELHFDDASFLSPGGRVSLAQSVRNHLSLIGENPAYSESTVFPAAAMSPQSWIDKIRFEIGLGLRNIFLMSGTWFFTEPYWSALADALPELNDLAQ